MPESAALEFALETRQRWAWSADDIRHFGHLVAESIGNTKPLFHLPAPPSPRPRLPAPPGAHPQPRQRAAAGQRWTPPGRQAASPRRRARTGRGPGDGQPARRLGGADANARRAASRAMPAVGS